MNAHDLLGIERIAAYDKPFANIEYLELCIQNQCMTGLTVLAHRYKDAEALLSVLDHLDDARQRMLLLHPVLRIAVNHLLYENALSTLATAACGALRAISVLSEGIALSDQSALTPFSTLSIDVQGDSVINVWSPLDNATDPITAYLCSALSPIISKLGMSLPARSDIDLGVLKRIRAGCILLTRLLPHLGLASVWHLKILVLSRSSYGCVTSTSSHLPGIALMSLDAVDTVLSVAENLLHESTHLKDIDIEYTHAILSDEHSHNVASIHPLWRRSSSPQDFSWTVQHGITVLHVYLALSLYYHSILLHPDLLRDLASPSDWDPKRERLRCLNRARFMVRELRKREASLGIAGIAMLRWTAGILTALQTEDSIVNLFHIKDLYERETLSISQLLLDLDGGSTAWQDLGTTLSYPR